MKKQYLFTLKVRLAGSATGIDPDFCTQQSNLIQELVYRPLPVTISVFFVPGHQGVGRIGRNFFKVHLIFKKCLLEDHAQVIGFPTFNGYIQALQVP